ncbi:hypothetical protein TNCT_23511 [Trichonephila clavata]|uniref:Uncharacterized protein n=1 Tax=Trichonephila clavata TaxID=2740835 RepID=A0A8X6F110_TRICU|nr:hypothetical protein TNCT_23511 [Trichonephila clavata]
MGLLRTQRQQDTNARRLSSRNGECKRRNPLESLPLGYVLCGQEYAVRKDAPPFFEQFLYCKYFDSRIKNICLLDGQVSVEESARKKDTVEI